MQKKIQSPAKAKTKAYSFVEQWAKVIVFAFAFLLYANTIPNQYNLDDELVTTTDPEYPHRLTSKGLAAIPEIISSPYYADEQGYAYDYRPVVLITYAIENDITNGGNIHISHFINALLYALLCLVLFSTLQVLFRNYSWLLAFLATLFFVAHPVHTEVVASAKNRDEILALLFAILSLRVLFKAEGIKSVAHILLAALLFALALGSKKTIISFAAITPMLYIFFGAPSFIVPFLFSVLAASLFIPVSGFISIWESMKFVALFPTFVAALYLLKNFTPKGMVLGLKSWFENQPAMEEVETGIYQPFVVKPIVVVVVASVLIAASVALFFLDIPLYLLPATMVFALPFVLADRYQQWAVGVIMLISSAFVIIINNSDTLHVVILVYLLCWAFFKRARFYYILPIAFLVVGIIALPRVEFEVFAITALSYIALFLNYRKALLIGSSALFVLVTLVPLIFESVEHFLIVQIYSFAILNTAIVWVLLNKPVLRKYLWPPIVLVMMGIVSLNNYSELRYRTTADVYDMAVQPAPQIIETSKIDRPINLVEAVTNETSPVEYRLGTAAQVFNRYLRLVVIPYPLSFYYGYKIIDKESVYKFSNVVTLMVYGLIFVVALFYTRRNSLIAGSLFLYLIGISIYSNYQMSVPGMMADRFLLIPSIGFVILLAYVIIVLAKAQEVKPANFTWNTLPNKLKYPVTVILLTYSVMTMARNRLWENHVTLFKADVKHLEASAQANNLTALQLVKYSFKEMNPQKQAEMRLEAETHFKKALSVYPEFANAQYDLARTQYLLGKLSEAEANFYKAGLLNPEYASTWLTAGELAMQDKRYSVARAYYLKGMQYIHNDPVFYTQASLTCYMEAKFDSANVINKEGMRKFPVVADFPINIGQTFAAMNQKDSALYYLNVALAISPQNKAALDIMSKLK